MSKAVLTRTLDKGAIWIVTINRPSQRNAINRDVQRGLYDAFISFEKDPKSKVAILRGKGTTFCGGADLKAIAQNPTELFPSPMTNLQSHKSNKQNISPYLESRGYIGVSRLLLTKPVIAAIRGYSVAGGLELALWCDIRIADKTAKFGVFCRRFGVPLMDGGNVRLPKVVGLGNAMDMILTGKEVDAKEALRIGLITRLIEPSEEVLTEAIKTARLIAKFPQNCMKLDRMNVYKSYGVEWLEQIANESGRALKSKAMKEIQVGPSKFAKGVGKHGSYDAFRGKASKL